MYFYPRPPRGGRRGQGRINGIVKAFLSTPSARRATIQAVNMGLSAMISIHALREEGDRFGAVLLNQQFDFYPRPPRGGRRSCLRTLWQSWKNFYPRPPRGGRLRNSWKRYSCSIISIHALREEGDILLFIKTFPDDNFYPRPPRGGRRVMAFSRGAMQYFYPRPPRGGRQFSFDFISTLSVFLSTPSARRATIAHWQILSGKYDFYPRPPRGGRRWSFGQP